MNEKSIFPKAYEWLQTWKHAQSRKKMPVMLPRPQIQQGFSHKDWQTIWVVVTANGYQKPV